MTVHGDTRIDNITGREMTLPLPQPEVPDYLHQKMSNGPEGHDLS